MLMPKGMNVPDGLPFCIDLENFAPEEGIGLQIRQVYGYISPDGTRSGCHMLPLSPGDQVALSRIWQFGKSPMRRVPEQFLG